MVVAVWLANGPVDGPNGPVNRLLALLQMPNERMFAFCKVPRTVVPLNRTHDDAEPAGVLAWLLPKSVNMTSTVGMGGTENDIRSVSPELSVKSPAGALGHTDGPGVVGVGALDVPPQPLSTAPRTIAIEANWRDIVMGSPERRTALRVRGLKPSRQGCKGNVAAKGSARAIGRHEAEVIRRIADKTSYRGADG